MSQPPDKKYFDLIGQPLNKGDLVLIWTIAEEGYNKTALYLYKIDSITTSFWPNEIYVKRVRRLIHDTASESKQWSDSGSIETSRLLKIHPNIIDNLEAIIFYLNLSGVPFEHHKK